MAFAQLTKKLNQRIGALGDSSDSSAADALQEGIADAVTFLEGDGRNMGEDERQAFARLLYKMQEIPGVRLLPLYKDLLRLSVAFASLTQPPCITRPALLSDPSVARQVALKMGEDATWSWCIRLIHGMLQDHRGEEEMAACALLGELGISSFEIAIELLNEHINSIVKRFSSISKAWSRRRGRKMADDEWPVRTVRMSIRVCALVPFVSSEDQLRPQERVLASLVASVMSGVLHLLLDVMPCGGLGTELLSASQELVSAAAASSGIMMCLPDFVLVRLWLFDISVFQRSLTEVKAMFDDGSHVSLVDAKLATLSSAFVCHPQLFHHACTFFLSLAIHSLFPSTVMKSFLERQQRHRVRPSVHFYPLSCHRLVASLSHPPTALATARFLRIFSQRHHRRDALLMYRLHLPWFADAIRTGDAGRRIAAIVKKHG